ncbi:MAG TPA: helix-turn-helix transcriptional regulator [Sediminibacterium sp.]
MKSEKSKVKGVIITKTKLINFYERKINARELNLILYFWIDRKQGTLTQGLIELKMYEKKLKQKELAKLLNTTDTKLSEIMHNKRKPSLSFLKAMHEVLGIDGNLLLKIA